MPLTRSSTEANRLVSPLIPQKRKSAPTATTSSGAEALTGEAASSDDPNGDDGGTWSDVDQDDTPVSSMNELIDQVLFLDNERQSPWTERGAPDKPRHWANQYVRTQHLRYLH